MFTDRQRQLVILISQGNSMKEAGEAMGVTVRTVKSQADTIRHKLGVDKVRRIPAAYIAAFGSLPDVQITGKMRG